MSIPSPYTGKEATSELHLHFLTQISLTVAAQNFAWLPCLLQYSLHTNILFNQAPSTTRLNSSDLEFTLFNMQSVKNKLLW